jgi:hypothetical protein
VFPYCHGLLFRASRQSFPLHVELEISALWVIKMTPGVGFTPALYPHERKAISPFLSAFTILLVIGVVFGYEVLAQFILWGLIPFFILTSALPIITAMGFYNLIFIATLVSGFSSQCQPSLFYSSDLA